MPVAFVNPIEVAGAESAVSEPVLLEALT